MNALEQFKEIMKETDNVVFFGGAGVSTESGIPDFRSVDGLYNQKYDYPPETILSHTFYRNFTEEFYRFYRDKMICLTAKPNKAHLKLAQWEAEGKLRGPIFDRDGMPWFRKEDALEEKNDFGREPADILAGNNRKGTGKTGIGRYESAFDGVLCFCGGR